DDRRGEGAKASRDELRSPAHAGQLERFFAPLDRRVDVAERELDQTEVVRGGRGVEGRAELYREPATLVVEVSRAVEILAEEGDVAQVRQHRHPARVVVQTAGNLEACLERLLGRLDVAVLRGED